MTDRWHAGHYILQLHIFLVAKAQKAYNYVVWALETLASDGDYYYSIKIAFCESIYKENVT